MPLRRGSTRKTVGTNIREMMKAGHPQNQAVAASLREARDTKRAGRRHHKRGGRRGSHER